MSGESELMPSHWELLCFSPAGGASFASVAALGALTAFALRRRGVVVRSSTHFYAAGGLFIAAVVAHLGTAAILRADPDRGFSGIPLDCSPWGLAALDLSLPLIFLGAFALGLASILLTFFLRDDRPVLPVTALLVAAAYACWVGPWAAFVALD